VRNSVLIGKLLIALVIFTLLAPVGRAEGATSPGPVVVVAAAPTYTPVLIAARIQGDVRIRVNIGPNGKVTRTTLIDGKHPLETIAMEAARRWKFKPSGAENSAILRFTFKALPEGAPKDEVGTFFFPPFRVELRGLIPNIPRSPAEGRRADP